MIIDNYDYEKPFYRYLYDNFFFGYLRRLYYAIKGEYPDAQLILDFTKLNLGKNYQSYCYGICAIDRKLAMVGDFEILSEETRVIDIWENIITGLMSIKENTFALLILTTGISFVNQYIKTVFHFAHFIPC